ncbi:hypothetical protein EPO33_03875 [Patescibacteria group bacterium]|nr:MAG: hypothetical protein EPO33_03875 [Patescibacteria group bacterium]
MRLTPLLSVLSTITLVGAGCFPSTPAITSFEECAAAGNPVMESYPRQCRTPDGRSFTEEVSPPPSLGLWAEPNGIVVTDQQPGASVTISAIIMEKAGWIVIHKEAAGKPGVVIGEARLVAGESSQIKVSLREATLEGMGYYAMLHMDDGDGRFNIAKDAPVRSSVLDGIIMARFEASAEAGEPPVVNP